MKLQLLALMICMLSTTVMAGEPREAAPPMEFDKYYMVFLVRPDEPQDHGEERNAELQRQHLGHLTWLWEEGYAHVAGPFGASADDPLRGIVLLRGDLTMERARELAEMDPRVKAGQLEVEIREWFTGAGVMAFPMQPEKTEAEPGD